MKKEEKEGRKQAHKEEERKEQTYKQRKIIMKIE
jgi:hypothetical protein